MKGHWDRKAFQENYKERKTIILDAKYMINGHTVQIIFVVIEDV